jgi:putative endonuclease
VPGRTSARTSSRSSPPPRNAAERRAARWYRLRGYRILDTNCWLSGNEIDIVARRGSTIVFCEVKSRADESFGDPLELVTAEKARRVRRAASAWLARQRGTEGLAVRFDVIAEWAGRIEHVPDAF